MRLRNALLVALSATLVMVAPAGATTLMVPPEAPPYLINPAAPGLDVLEAILETPGVTFGGTGFVDLDAGWLGTVTDPTHAVEWGPTSNYLTEHLSIVGAGPGPFAVNFYGFAGGCIPSTCSANNLADAYRVTANGDGGYIGWTALTMNDYDRETASPEASTLLLLGLGLSGLGLGRRRFQH